MTDLRIRLAPTTRLIGAALLAAAALAPRPTRRTRAPAGGRQAAPAEEPSTLILSDTLHYDDVKKQSVFTGNVNMTRGLMTLTSDTLEMHEDAKGNQYGTATANKGKVVTIRQERPRTSNSSKARACAPNTTAPTAPSTSSARPWWCATSVANRSTPSVANGYA